MKRYFGDKRINTPHVFDRVFPYMANMVHGLKLAFGRHGSE
jgi:hypothetical protein